ALVSGDARIQDVVVAALDHVDGVDLNVAQVLHGKARRLGPVPEWHGSIEPLGVQPDASGPRLGEGVGLAGGQWHGGTTWHECGLWERTQQQLPCTMLLDAESAKAVQGGFDVRQD